MIALWFLAFGCLFFLFSSIGILRFPDFFSRMHAASKSSSLGIGLILTGVALHFGSLVVAIKCALVIFFIFLTTPISAHILGRAGYLSGAGVWHGTKIDELRSLYED